MLVKICSNNENLVDSLNRVDEFEVDNTCELFIGLNYDILIADESIISLSEVILNKSRESPCYYICSDNFLENNNYDEDYLEMNRIIFLGDDEENLDIIRRIKSDVKRIISENNVIGFFGADGNVGTSLLSYLVAKKLAERSSDKKVFLLSLTGLEDFAWSASEEGGYGLSNVRIALSNEVLSLTELKKMSYMVSENFYALKGESNIAESQTYHQSDIIKLIELVKSAFDVVIIDLGSVKNITLRMTYAGLIEADNKFLITDQMSKSLFLYDTVCQQVFKHFNMKKFKFVILNKYIRDSVLPKVKSIEEKYELPVVAKLPYLDTAIQSAFYNSTNNFCNEKEFNSGLVSIAEIIEKKLGFKIVQSKRKRISRFLGSR